MSGRAAARTLKSGINQKKEEFIPDPFLDADTVKAGGLGVTTSDLVSEIRRRDGNSLIDRKLEQPRKLRRGSVLVRGQLKSGKTKYRNLLPTKITSLLHKGRGKGGGIVDNSPANVCQRIHANDHTLTTAYLGGQVRGCARHVSRAIQHNSYLTSLNLSNNQVTWLDVSKLATALWESPNCGASLKVLNLSCNDINEEGAKFVSEIIHNTPSITDLNLAKNRILDDGVLFIATVLYDSIEADDVIDSSSNTVVEHDPFTTNENTKYDNDTHEDESIPEVNIDKAVVSNESTPKKTQLQSLNLSANMIGGNPTMGIGKLLEALKTNHCLTELDLSYNYLSGRRLAVDISNVLSMNKTIKHINLYSNGIADRATLIVKGLMNNETLESLNLMANGVGFPAESQLGKLAISAQQSKAEAYSFLENRKIRKNNRRQRTAIATKSTLWGNNRGGGGTQQMQNSIGTKFGTNLPSAAPLGNQNNIAPNTSSTELATGIRGRNRRALF